MTYKERQAVVCKECEQKEHNNWIVKGHTTGYRQTDHHTYCPELGLRWSIDSGD